VTAGGGPVSGDSISFTTSDIKQKVGPVTDNGDGTYTAKLKTSTKVATATITATDTSVSPTVSGSASLKQMAKTAISLTVKPTSIHANGQAHAVATAKVTRGGLPAASDSISFTSSDPGQSIGPVTNLGNGRYAATITASQTVGTAKITATDTTIYPTKSASANLKQT
jgi:adhesin/invasin